MRGELSNMLLFNQVSVIAITLIPFDFMKWDISVILMVSDRALNVQILKSRSWGWWLDLKGIADGLREELQVWLDLFPDVMVEDAIRFRLVFFLCYGVVFCRKTQGRAYIDAIGPEVTVADALHSGKNFQNFGQA